MKRTTKWQLIFFLMFSFNDMFPQCIDTLNLCQYGKNIIPFKFKDDSLKIKFTNAYGASSPYYDVICQDSQIVFSTLFNLSYQGNYTIKLDSFSTCYGLYLSKGCIDQLEMETDYYCFENEFHPCNANNLINGNITFGFCLGDTNSIRLLGLGDLDNSYFQAFTPERLELTNGELVSYTDSTFYIKWTKTGEDCLRLSTISDFGDTLYASTFIKVHPNKALDVIKNGSISTETEICVGDILQLKLDKLSSELVYWVVNNSTTYYEPEPNFEFQKAGEYLIKAYQDQNCVCTPPSEYKVIVKESEKPKIQCVRTACLNEEVTYKSDNQCDSYIWTLSDGGEIIEGGKINDDYVIVKWTSGYSNSITLETPECLNSLCERSATELVNIINPNVEIQGPKEVCHSNVYIYSTPLYTGTIYNWQITGHGIILNGQGSNNITVRWFTDTLAHEKVTVSYDNCNIDCNGYAELEVVIKPSLKMIYNSLDLCQDHEFAFENSLGIAVKWIVTAEDSTSVMQHNGNTLLTSFTSPGYYTVTMIDTTASTCNQNEKVIFNILPFLNPPTSIYGPTTVCLNIPSQYQVSGLKPSEIVYWSIYDGDTLVPALTTVSLDAVYTWTSSGPYKVTAYKKNTITGCESTALSIYPTNNNTIVGSNTICLYNDQYYYLQSYNGELLTWTITPSNAGSIISSSSGWVRISWKTLGNHTINTKYCGNNVQLKVNVIDSPDVDIDYDEVVCFGEKSKVIVNIKSGETFVIKQNNLIISESNPTYLPKGNYQVIVSNKACSSNDYIYISSQPNYDITIILVGPNLSCPPMPSQTIFIQNPSPNFKYEWYFNSNITGSNTPEIKTIGYGLYGLKVTDTYGCTSTSEEILLEMCCDTTVTNNIVSTLKPEKEDVTCGIKNFKVDPPYKGDKFVWYFDYKNNSSLKGYGTNVSYTYKKAGSYLVVVQSNADCDTLPPNECTLLPIIVCENGFIIVEIPIVADFNVSNGCTNESIHFQNTSTSTSNGLQLEYQWDFGDPSSGLNNNSTLKNPNHTYKNPGKYWIRLITSQQDICSDTTFKSIEIFVIPTETISSRDVFCVGEIAKFDAIGTTNGVYYNWDFGDPISGYNNKSYVKSPTHQFNSPGTYNVRLTSSTNLGNCNSTKLKSIKVIDNYLNGQITCNIPLPKCPSDSAILTAPIGDYSYLWSNGDTSPNITVLNPGYFKVTITHSNVCAFTPPGFSVFNHDIIKSKLYAKKYFSASSYTTYYDSLTVCVGDSFDLLCAQIPSASYSWSNGYNVDYKLKYNDFFKNLTPGRYVISCIVSLPNNGCTIETKPFIIRVIDSPPKPHIAEINNLHCDGNKLKLYVETLHQNLTYSWNNGLKSDTITVPNSGDYYIKATGPNGCSIKSDILTIYPTPKTNEWITGCMEACLPREFCINFNQVNQYELYLDGVFLKNINNNAKTIELSDEGDYQVKITNPYGCEAISDLFSLTSKTNVHSIIGKVYYDINENNVYDEGIDSLLNNIPVTVSKDSTIIKSLETDLEGKFEFDSLLDREMQVNIDIKESGYSLSGNLDSILLYSTCIENKIVDFPLKKDCISRITNLTAYTCYGEKTIIGDITYEANDKDTLIIPVNKNCDSLVIIEVIERERPSLDFNVVKSCSEYASGELKIINQNGMALQYSLDEKDYNTDSIITNLEKGYHTLWVENQYGCKEKFVFNIGEFYPPLINLETTKTCPRIKSGIMSINVIQGSNLGFSLDTIGDYTNTSIFENLDTGNYVLQIQDTVGCKYEQPFNIGEYVAPQLNYSILNTCRDFQSGNLQIQVEDGNKYKIDSVTSWSTQGYYDQLSFGSHILYAITEHGCIDSSAFIIEYVNEPTVELTTINTCKGSATGSIILTGDSIYNLKFRLNETGSYSNTTLYQDLAYGNYTLYYQDSLGCTYSKPIIVENLPLPSFEYEIKNSCKDQENGKITITTSENILFSLDDIHFIDSLNVLSPLSSGTHRLYSKTKYGCLDSIDIELGESQIPIIEIITTSQCESSNLGNLKIEGEQGLLFSFNGNEYDTLTSKNNLTSGDHALFIKTSDGCIYEKTYNIPLTPKPNLQASTISTCKGVSAGSIFFDGIDDHLMLSLDSVSYEYVDSFTKLAAGQYTVYVLNEIGCAYQYPITVLENSLPTFSFSCEYSCPNKGTGTISIFSDVHHLTSINGNPFQSQNIYEDLEKGNYLITVKDSLNCMAERQAEINSLPDLKVTFPELELDCYTNAVTIVPEVIYSNGNTSYLWNTGDETPSLKLTQSESYRVTVTDFCEQRTHEWSPDIQILDENTLLNAPNIFSPKSINGNECFRTIIDPNAEVIKYSLTIFDRWGNMVFQSYRMEDCWDGTFNGIPMVGGVYVYIANIEILHCDSTKKVKKTGDVTLIY